MQEATTYWGVFSVVLVFSCDGTTSLKAKQQSLPAAQCTAVHFRIVATGLAWGPHSVDTLENKGFQSRHHMVLCNHDVNPIWHDIRPKKMKKRTNNGENPLPFEKQSRPSSKNNWFMALT